MQATSQATYRATQAALSDIEKKIERIRKIRKTYKKHIRILDALASEPRGYFFCSEHSPHAYLSLTVQGFLADVEPDLIDILEYLSDELGTFPESCDNPQARERTYEFSCPDGFSITIMAKLSETATCQRVEVGRRQTTKWVQVETEEPVFAFDCLSGNPA